MRPRLPAEATALSCPGAPCARAARTRPAPAGAAPASGARSGTVRGPERRIDPQVGDGDDALTIAKQRDRGTLPGGQPLGLQQILERHTPASRLQALPTASIAHGQPRG